MSKKDSILSGGLNALLGAKPKFEVESPDGPVSEKEETLATQLEERRRRGCGRPRKGQFERQTEGLVYIRATNIYRKDQIDKIHEICFRETITIKEFMEAALGLAIEKYEKINGEVIPSEHKNDLSKLFKE